MRFKSANQSLITDVSGFVPTAARSFMLTLSSNRCPETIALDENT
jgi:hypothetical protein